MTKRLPWLQAVSGDLSGFMPSPVIAAGAIDATKLADAYAHQLAGVRIVSGNYSVAAGDGLLLCNAAGGAFTVTLPAISATTVPPGIGSIGVTYRIRKTDSTVNPVTIAAQGSDTIAGISVLVAQNEQVDLTCDLNAGPPYRWDSSGLGWQRLLATADQSVNNSTALVSSSYLTFTPVTAARYIVRGLVFFNSTAVADLKYTLTASGHSGGWTATSGQGLAGLNIGPASGAALNALGSGSATALGGAGTGDANLAMASIIGLVITSGTSPIVFQFAQNTAENSAPGATVMKGSVLEVLRVA